MAAIVWFRRDLRLADNPALLAARDASDSVVALFVLDPALRRPSGAARLAFLAGCLRELSERTDAALVIRTGDPVTQVSRLAREVAASSVHVAADYGPYGARRDEAVAAALGDVELVRTGSPWAVAPGRVRKADGSPFSVFTPFSRAWQAHGWRPPAPDPGTVGWQSGVASDPLPDDTAPDGVSLPPAGEAAAARAWQAFLADGVRSYGERRNVPGEAGTSRMSVYLKYGCVHPRTLLADLPEGPGAATYRTELCWRDFYADVLARNPQARAHSLVAGMERMTVDSGDTADARFTAWAAGRTGYPFVDAGMRQLLGEGWMHNRVRMVVASFLVKDLHVDWTRGARHFMTHLVDGELSSNALGWQWVAGTGTDAAPYFRVFNPVTQGRTHDPDGAYVRRWVPELRGVPDRFLHEPWRAPGGPPQGYPLPIVDHATERLEALERYRQTRS